MMKSRVLVLVLVTCAVLWWYAYLLSLSPPRRALLVYGSDVKEYCRDFGIIPDFDYYLSARLDAQRFPSIARQLELTAVTDPTEFSQTIVGWGDCPEAWWKSELTLDSAYIRYEPECEFYAIAKMDGDRIYYHALRW